jgi:ABC-2 type transport system permease protein
MRTLKTPITLFLYLLVMGSVIFGYTYLRYVNTVYYNPGDSRELFIILAVLQLLLIAFVAPGLTAGTISGERERQTLNILLTTHVSPLKIVLSKLVSSLSFMSLLVFSTLPVYALIFLFGGVSPGQVLGVFGFYLMAMILFGSVGVFCSAWFKRTGVSTVTAYMLTFFLLGGTGLAVLFLIRLFELTNGYGSYPSLFYVAALNPILNLISMFEPNVVMIKNPSNPPIPPWLYFLLVYMAFSALLIYLGVRKLMPVKRPILQLRRKGEKAR